MATEQDSDAQNKLAVDLYEAVDNNDVPKVRSLLGQGADPNHQLYWSNEWRYKAPPLHSACCGGYLEIVTTLVTHGARTDKGGGIDNKTPLHYACWLGHKEVVQYLIQEVGCSTDVRDKNNMTLLHLACEGESKDMVQYLVEELKMDVDVRDDKGQSPLDEALGGWRDECVDVALYLMSRGCGGDEDKAKLLCAACSLGNLGVVQELVEQHKVDPKNVKDDKGQSPLDVALEEWYHEDNGCMNVALYLMSRGCACGDEDKAKLLCAACSNGNLGVVKELVEQHKIDPKNVRDDENWTLLHKACFRGHKDVVQYLVEKANCDIDVRDYENMTPLHNACLGGHKDVVQYLVEKANCDIDVRDYENMTPLHKACVIGHKDVLQYLVEKANCDISVTDVNGETPLDIATQRGHTETADYLKSLPHENGPSPTKKQKGAQPVTQRVCPQRVCPNCEESCHIRCKKCPECEHEFPPSTKSSAKPDQDIVKNPSSLRRKRLTNSRIC